MVKPYDNGGLESVVDYVTQKVLIRYTTLRSFIPPQVNKMTPKLHHIYICELCIIPKDMQIDFNIFRRRLVTYLQQIIFGRHTCNSLFSTKSASHYKDRVFPDGGGLLPTINNAS